MNYKALIIFFFLMNMILLCSSCRNKNRELYKACRDGNIKVVENLLKEGVNPNGALAEGTDSPLMVASLNGDIDIVKLLIRHKADINGKNTVGQAPLAFACKKGHDNIVRELVNNGADINNKSNIGLTALILATCHDHIKTVKLLIANGAKVNIMDKEDKTALNYAIHGRSKGKNREALIKLLREHGAKTGAELKK